MEKLRLLVSEIACGKDKTKLSHHAITPFLSAASLFYNVAHRARIWCYRHSILRARRLPVPVISVGNITWGGNGKTPMSVFIACLLLKRGISPLILTRGYAGGDEANMLMRYFRNHRIKIGVGANRFATATHFLRNYGYRNREEIKAEHPNSNSGNIDAVILDDGMQHLSLHRDLEIVMVNALSPWGNGELLPLGPLREPRIALERADAIVIHHANLATKKQLRCLHAALREVNRMRRFFHTGMFASHLFGIDDVHSSIPLDFVRHRVLLCVSGIGLADAFVMGMEKVGARFLDRVDFCDHHKFNRLDMDSIRCRLNELAEKFGEKPTVVITEKDYDRDPEAFKAMHPYKVMVLCSKLKLMSENGKTLKDFESLLMNTWR